MTPHEKLCYRLHDHWRTEQQAARSRKVLACVLAAVTAAGLAVANACCRGGAPWYW